MKMGRSTFFGEPGKPRWRRKPALARARVRAEVILEKMVSVGRIRSQEGECMFCFSLRRQHRQSRGQGLEAGVMGEIHPRPTVTPATSLPTRQPAPLTAAHVAPRLGQPLSMASLFSCLSPSRPAGPT